MARTCKVAKEAVRQKLSKTATKARGELKKVISDLKVEYDDKIAAIKKLNQRRRNESKVRRRSRCRVCGRSRGVYRKFGLCRIHLREAAMRGEVPGLVKSSW